MYEQRDIILIPFPYTDLSGMKLRPALIVSNAMINNTHDRVCCLITSNPEKGKWKIHIDSVSQGTLPFKSWVKPHRVFTIHEGIIKKRICQVSDNVHEKVVSSIQSYIDNFD